MTKLPNLEQTRRSSSLQSLIARELNFDKHAWESGFYQRKPKKLTVQGLILGFWQMQHQSKNSLRHWAMQAGYEQGSSLCKQSLSERLDDRAVALAKRVLKSALSNKVGRKWEEQFSKTEQSLLGRFNRITIQDSTTQKLPANLYDIFSGSYSHTQPAALLRLQALFDLTHQQWLDFSVDTYRENDQSQALLPLEQMEENDLLIRDLGYFSLASIAQICQHHYLITKWDNRTTILNQKGQKIELLDLFQGKKQIDQPIRLGLKAQLPMRLVARKLPKAKAQERIRRARADRHGAANHSQQYYQLLQYEIYLTNVPSNYLDAKLIAKLYALRWYIEILFKSWKSYANFRTMLQKKQMTYHRTLVSIYLLLIQFAYFTGHIYAYIRQHVGRYTDRAISILKYMDLISGLCPALTAISSLEQLQQWILLFAQHATYEKRNKRQNMIEKYLYFKELHIKFI